jgi:acetylornithine deacetylase/succinyl-diaminopimelate desuccinylase-like protein
MPRVKFHFAMVAAILLLALPGRPQDPAAVNTAAHEIFKQLIEINTTDSVGNVTAAAEAMAARFRDAGFPDKDVIVAGPTERKKNLVVRIHGDGKRKPVLFIGHLDVVAPTT